MCFGMFLLGFILYGTLCFLALSECFLSPIRESFDYNFFKYFLRPFLFLFSFWVPYDANVRTFNVVPEVSETVLISLNSFFFILFCGSDFHHSVFQLTYSFFCLSYSAIGSF